ncbi:unnamed protein product [Adineta ricciae]|uniref:Uncharacterized protein n=1 Tax=Adineta ricciae TaxID=249248 RepID=A0A816AMB1_ADIRI|nr:unnamed protein product [Adineta ricciae]
MDQQFDFRALLVKLQDCLSDNDRRRLHFIVGDTIPRQLRDDPSLGGTLNLLETLFDQAKINEQDFNYLIQVFQEIQCHEAVKRLKEHQLREHQRGRSGTNSTNVSDVLDDNDVDRVIYTNLTPQLNTAFYHPKERDATSTHSTIISFDQKSTSGDKITLTNPSIYDENKMFNLNKTLVKKIFKSRVTISQLFLCLLNVIGIVIFLLLLIFFTKTKQSNSDILAVKISPVYGSTKGGDVFNDATDCSLTRDDRIVKISAGWTDDILDFVTIFYTQDKSKQHGVNVYRSSAFTSSFALESNENINGASIYVDMRAIPNPFSPNGTYIVVGLRFYTDQGRASDLFGSSKGIVANETTSTYRLKYIQGRSAGYVDAIQFIWYKLIQSSNIASLSED